MSIPVIGFGTAPILGRIARRPSQRALTFAFDMGVRHFDTARSYGWGEAESVLGDFLSHHRRESYTLVSKCGIVPVPRSRFLSLAKDLARHALKLVPSARRVVLRVASTSQFRPAQTYDTRVLSESLAASLRELRTSYLDILLLHNFEPGREGLTDVIAWLREQQRAGNIRRFGFSVEGDLHDGLACLARHSVLEDCVIQAPVSSQLLSLPSEWRNLRFIAHSPFKFLAHSAAARTGATARFEHLLAALGEACRCEAVVGSMFTLAHVEQNVRARVSATGLSSRDYRQLFRSIT